MTEEKEKGSFMIKLASFVVDRRNLFFLIYIIAMVFSVIAMNWVEVENDITQYLPSDTETRQGLTVMNDNFVTYGTARVMVSNVSYPMALTIQERIKNVEGVDEVKFDETSEHFKDGFALFTVTFNGTVNDDISKQAMQTIRDELAEYDLYVNTTVGVDASADLAKEMVVIVAVAALIIAVVLTLTSRAYAEVPVLALVFGSAALLNMGTNFLCGKISFISKSVTIVLQLALAIDYAIIMCHRFGDEHQTKPSREACITALSKAIPEIGSSSLTTISGLAALGFMHFGIGLDLAIVLIKAILFSLLSVFTLMPGLLMLFSPLIDKTQHRKLLPEVEFIGKFDVKSRFIVPPIFAVVIVVAFFLAGKCPYCYTYTDLVTPKQSESQIAYQKIKGVFGVSNTVAIVVPTGDYVSEGAVLNEIAELDGVTTTTGLSSVKVKDDYVLTSALNPRQFSELAGVDYEVAQLLYSAYAADKKEYGEIIDGLTNYRVPLFDICSFLKDQMRDGHVTLSDDKQEDVDRLFDKLDKAKLQLKSEKYSRMVVILSLQEESDETTVVLKQIHDIVGRYYDSDWYVVGNSTSATDLASSFGDDNNLISVLSALFVIVILLFTFQSAGLPVLLIIVIQGSIWLNFSFPYLQGKPLYFLGYLIVNSIQMGANIDYAIVISSHYRDLKAHLRPKEAIVQALNESFPTIFTSGSILASAGVLISVMTANPVIAAIGECLGRGTIASILLVLCVLPQILLIGDTIIEYTSFALPKLNQMARTATGSMRVHGRVRGYVNGVIDAEVNGVLHGQFNAMITTGMQDEGIVPLLPEAAPDNEGEPKEGGDAQ